MRKTARKYILVTTIILLIVGTLYAVTFQKAQAADGINRQINFQGKVVNSNGTNVADGSYDFVFKIYTQSSGGAAVWTETRTGGNQVQVIGGIFRVSLGSVQALPGSVNFNSDSIYLGIEFNSDGEMSPRVRFASVPYAFNAEKVNGLTVQNTSSNPFSSTTTLQIADGKTVVINNGLTFSGTDSTTFTFPSGSGTVVTLDSTAILTNKTIGSTGLTFSGATTDITTASNEDLVIVGAGTGNINLGGDFDSQVLIGSTGMSTEFPLFINNSIGTNASLAINNINGADLFTASASGTTKFRIDNSGNLQFNQSAQINAGGSNTLTLNSGGTGNVQFFSSSNNLTSSGVLTLAGGLTLSSGPITLGGSTGSGLCITGGATATWGSCGSGGANYWQINSGLLSPFSNTLDFALGATATDSASFAVLGIAAGTSPTASVSAVLGGNAGKGVVLGGDGSIQSLRRGTLSVGGSTTGLVNILNSAGSPYATFDTVNSRLGIGLTNPSVQLVLSGSTDTSARMSLRQTASGGVSWDLISSTNALHGSQDGDLLFWDGSSTVMALDSTQNEVGIGTIAPAAKLHVYDGSNTSTGIIVDSQGTGSSQQATFDLITSGNGQRVLQDASSLGWDIFARGNAYTTAAERNDFGISYWDGTRWNNVLRFDSIIKNVGIGTTSPISELHVSRDLTIGATGKALAIFDQTEDQDILTASASGVTKFTIKNDGSSSQSGSLTLDAAGSIQTTKQQQLTIGGATTGDITISPLNGAAGSILNLNTVTLTSAATTVTLTSAAVSVSSLSSSGAIAANGGITFDNSSDTLGAHTLGGAITGNNQSITGLNSVTAASLALGTNPAAAGTLMIPNNTYITARNAANNADINLIKIDGSNLVAFGANTAALTLGGAITGNSQNITGLNSITGASLALGTNPAAAGTLMLPNNTYITTRNAANNADINLIKIDGSNLVAFGANLAAHTLGGAVTGNSQDITGVNSLGAVSLTITGSLSANGSTGAGLCLTGGATATWGSCGGGGGSNWWQMNSTTGILAPGNLTTDTLFGTTATSSAKVRIASSLAGGMSALIVNQTENQPDILTASASGVTKFTVKTDGTASMSGNLVMDSLASIQTTKFQALALGGSTTGFVNVLNKAGSPFATFDTTNSRLGIGTAAPSYALDLLSTNATQARLGYDSSNYLTAAISSAGFATFDAVGSGAGFNFADSVSFGVNSSSNASLTLYSSGSVSDPTLTVDSSGNLTISAPQAGAAVILGSGSGNIQMSLSNAADVLTADKTVTLAGAYSGTDFTFSRVLTGNFSKTGTVFKIEDTSSSNTISPDMLTVNAASTSTGNLLKLQLNSSDKFVVAYTGDLAVAGGTAITNSSSGTLGVGTSSNTTGLTLGNSTGTSTMTFNVTTAGNFVLQKNGAGLDCSTAVNSGKLTTNASGQISCAEDNSGPFIERNGLIFSKNTTTDFMIGGQATGSADFTFGNLNGVGVATATFSGNLVMNARPNTTQSELQQWTQISGTAGTIGGGATANIASVSASVIYNGSLYVGTTNVVNAAGTKVEAAEVYRYNGTGTSWTKISDGTAGTIISGGTTGIASVSAMTVFDGYMYIGTSKMNAAEVYRFDGNSWTKVSQVTAGTIASGGGAGIDGISALAVSNGVLYAGTREAGRAELYRFNGGTSWTAINSTAGSFSANAGTGNVGGVSAITAMVTNKGFLYLATQKMYTGSTGVADVVRYNGGIGNASANFTKVNSNTSGTFTVNGSAVASINEVTAMTVYNGSVVIGVNKPNGGDIYSLTDSSAASASSALTLSDQWVRLNNAAGQMANGGTSSIDGVSALSVYNGRLYAGTWERGGAEIYRFETAGTMTKVSGGAAGSIQGSPSSATSGLYGVNILQANTDELFAMTTKNNNGAEVYIYQAFLDQSYSLTFRATPGLAGGVMNGQQQEASIFFLASSSAIANNRSAQGGVFVFSNSIVTRNGAYDVAEDYPTRDDTLEPGDLVSIDTNEREYVVKSAPNDHAIIGVYSQNPALRLSQATGGYNGGDMVPVALAGRVPVKVTTENGNIEAGDYLTSSSTPGVAMKATKSGVVIGRAMGPYREEGIGKVVVYVSSNSYNGTTADLFQGLDSTSPDFKQEVLSRLSIESNEGLVSEINTDRLVAGLEIITPDIFATRASIRSLSADNATIAGVLTADVIRANRIEGLDIAIVNSIQGIAAQDSQNYELLNAKLASVSAKLTNLENLPLFRTLSATDSGSFVGVENFMVTGTTTLAEASILNRLSVGNTLEIGGSSINTLGQDLELQSLKQGGVSMFGGLITFSTEGNINVAGVLSASTVRTDELSVTRSEITVVSDTEVEATSAAGLVAIKSAKKEIKINNPKAHESSIIFLAPKANLELPIYIKEQSEGWFVVGRDKVSSQEAQFNFLIIN